MSKRQTTKERVGHDPRGAGSGSDAGRVHNTAASNPRAKKPSIKHPASRFTCHGSRGSIAPAKPLLRGTRAAASRLNSYLALNIVNIVRIIYRAIPRYVMWVQQKVAGLSSQELNISPEKLLRRYSFAHNPTKLLPGTP